MVMEVKQIILLNNHLKVTAIRTNAPTCKSYKSGVNILWSKIISKKVL